MSVIQLNQKTYCDADLVAADVTLSLTPGEDVELLRGKHAIIFSDRLSVTTKISSMLSYFSVLRTKLHP